MPILWGPRGSSTVNTQGLMVGELLNRCELHAISLGRIASGPDYTYHSGDKFTTIDYIQTDIKVSSCIDKCWIHKEDHLNLSDHLPVMVKLSCSAAARRIENLNYITIDWSKALSSEALTLIQDTLKDRLHTLL